MKLRNMGLVRVLVWVCGAVAVAQDPKNEDARKRELAAQEPATRALLLAHATAIPAVDAPFRAADYQALLTMMKGKRLILLSEPTHAMHECRAENAKLVRLLVEEAGVRTLVVELGYAEGLELDAFVRRGTGDVDDIVGVRGGMLWNTVEEADMMRWVAEWNRGHAKNMVRVVGMDVESGTAAGPALASLVGGMKLDAALVARVKSGAEAAVAMKGPAKATSSVEEKAASATYDADLVALLSALRALPASSAREDALRSATTVRDGRRVTEMRVDGPDGVDAGNRIREFTMARTALAVTAESTAPTVIVSHTAHQRAGRLAGDRVQSMGYHVARALGGQAFFLGEDYGTGTMRALVTPAVPGEARRLHAATLDAPMPGSIAAALGDKGPLLIDLRDPGDGSAWSEWLETMQATHNYPAIMYEAGDATKPNWTIPADAFDAMIYLPSVTPLHPIGAPPYAP